MNKRKIVLLAVALCMAAILGMGSTLAYLTDTDNATNVFTVGNVQIEQYEKDRNGNDFVDDQKLLPIVDDKKDSNGYHTGGNYIDKIVTVKNTGTEPAFLRTYIAFPANLDNGPTTYDPMKNILHWNGASANDSFGLANQNMDNDWYWSKDFTTDYPAAGSNAWNGYTTTVDGVLYNVYIATHKTAVAKGATTAPNLYGVYLDKGVDFLKKNDNGQDVYVDQNGNEFIYPASVEVLVMSLGVQSEGWLDTNGNGSAADEAFDEAFGKVGEYCPFGGTIGQVY